MYIHQLKQKGFHFARAFPKPIARLVKARVTIA
jgi:hypothetical protein